MKPYLVALLFCAWILPQGAIKNDRVSLMRDYRRANEHRILYEFVQLLSIPNASRMTRENIRRNASFIMEMMRALGLRISGVNAEV